MKERDRERKKEYVEFPRDLEFIQSREFIDNYGHEEVMDGKR